MISFPEIQAQGSKARREGQPISENPYKWVSRRNNGEQKVAAWIAGWNKEDTFLANASKHQ